MRFLFYFVQYLTWASHSFLSAVHFLRMPSFAGDVCATFLDIDILAYPQPVHRMSLTLPACRMSVLSGMFFMPKFMGIIYTRAQHRSGSFNLKPDYSAVCAISNEMLEKNMENPVLSRCQCYRLPSGCHRLTLLESWVLHMAVSQIGLGTVWEDN